MMDPKKDNNRPMSPASFPWRKPDRSAALDQYRRRARFYDLELALLEPVRRRAIERLALVPGDIMLDVGCGTGLSFELLHRRVGSEGKIIGIEQSSEMIGLARERAARNHWNNIELIQSPVEDAPIDVQGDAALFHFTHDILRTPGAVENVVRHLKPGARVVASGLKWARWGSPTNLLVLQAALISVTSLEGLAEPWSNLASLVDNIDVQSMLGGGVFIAAATTKL
jgi:ubiquinone/menaquinone biosynthesis C-methylase UbiE